MRLQMTNAYWKKNYKRKKKEYTCINSNQQSLRFKLDNF